MQQWLAVFSGLKRGRNGLGERLHPYATDAILKGVTPDKFTATYGAPLVVHWRKQMPRSSNAKQIDDSSHIDVRSPNRVAVERLLGEKLRFSRETLCGQSLTDAARLTGMEPSMLSKIETGQYKHLTIEQVVTFAIRYKVSVDFLLGLTGDFDFDDDASVKREISTWIYQVWEDSRKRDMETVAIAIHQNKTLRKLAKVFIAEAERMSLAMERFTRASPDYEEIAGLSMWFSACNNLSVAANAMANTLKK